MDESRSFGHRGICPRQRAEVMNGLLPAAIRRVGLPKLQKECRGD